MTIKVDDYGTGASAFAAAIAATGLLGGRVEMSSQIYETPPVNGMVCGVFIDRPLQLVGEGALYSAIKPVVESYGIVLRPNPALNCTHTVLKDFHVGNPYNGSREGLSAIFPITILPGEQLPFLTISGVTTGEGNSPAFYHINDQIVNPNGGMYCALIEGCAFMGGLYLDGSGDSIAIRDLTLSGSGKLFASLVAGATGPFVDNANITSRDGAIRHVRGHRFAYRDLNIEHTAGNGDRGVVVDIGGPYLIQGGEIRNALVSKFGTSEAYGLIRLENCHGTVIDNVTLLSGTPGCMGIDIMPSCLGVEIRGVKYNSNVTPIRDFGQGTRILTEPILLPSTGTAG